MTGFELVREHWSDKDYADFKAYLSSLSENGYKEFSAKLIPDTPHMYGIRVPALRSIAKAIAKGNYSEFLALEKGDFHEEIIIDGLVAASVNCGYDEMLSYMKAFADKIYNWSICDTVSFKRMAKYTDRLIGDMDYFIYNKNPWVVRYGFGCLMNFFLTDKYIDRVLDYVKSVKSDMYYVQMMQAWLVATAAAKQRDKTIGFLKERSLTPEVMKMTVRKMCDSYRISPEDKAFVKTLK